MSASLISPIDPVHQPGERRQHNRFKRVSPTDDEVTYFNAAVDRAVQKIAMVGQKGVIRTNGGDSSLTMQ
jgi:hypothetical protein